MDKTGVDFQAIRWFGGNRGAFLKWFANYGFFVYVKNSRPSALLPGGKFFGCHPGAHPAWGEMAVCDKCRCPVRDCVCNLPAF